jgi:GrpB-like predicted nucleotidyltransferase (UPF0157 family)
MKKYAFKPYNPLFPKLFEKEKGRLLAHLPDGTIIEHVGSTAVPGLGGKGIIDIAIATNENITVELERLGYEFRKPWSTPNRLYFRQDLPDPEQGTRRYHIHVMTQASKDWKEFLFFRDYLRKHPQAAQEYADLKKQAAEEVNEDGVKYRELKDPFFQKVLKKHESDTDFTS